MRQERGNVVQAAVNQPVQLFPNQPQQQFNTPPNVFAAFFGAVSMLGVIGTILTNDESYAVAGGLVLLASCAIRDIAYNNNHFISIPNYITKKWAAAVVGAAIVGIACNPSIVGLGS